MEIAQGEAWTARTDTHPGLHVLYHPLSRLLVPKITSLDGCDTAPACLALHISQACMCPVCPCPSLLHPTCSRSMLHPSQTLVEAPEDPQPPQGNPQHQRHHVAPPLIPPGTTTVLRHRPGPSSLPAVISYYTFKLVFPQHWMFRPMLQRVCC